jgi:hypothetical protein
MLATGRINTSKVLQNMRTPSLKKSHHPMLVGLLFLIINFFAVGCHNKKQPALSSCLTAEEKMDLEYFLRFLIFENYGAFVLFGSKPLCVMNVSDTDPVVIQATRQKRLASMSDDERTQWECRLEKCKANGSLIDVDFIRNPYDGWRALEKVRKTFRMKQYIIGVDDESERGDRRLVLANIQKTALVLAENYTIFKEAAGMDFHPLQVVFELQNPNSEFWKRIFRIKNHVAKGLLCGFGLKNSLFGDWRFKQFHVNVSTELEKEVAQYLKSVALHVSTKPVEFGKGSPSNFTIPLFGTVEGDDVVEKYKKEKREIEKTYLGQDLVEVTLQRLAIGSTQSS